MTLHDLLIEKFRVKTRAIENPVEDTVGTAPVRVLNNNPNRLGWLIVNQSANTVYVALSNRVSATYGVRLDANGGFCSMVWDEDFHATGWAVWAIATGVDSKIYVLEIVAT